MHAINTGRVLLFLSLALWWPLQHNGQTPSLSLSAAINMGLAHSHTLRLDKAAITAAWQHYQQVKDASLPTGSISATFSHMEVPADHLQLGNQDLTLGKRGENYMAHAGIRQTIFEGNKLRYARKSAQLLMQLSDLELEQHATEVAYTIAELYHDLYKIHRNIQVTQQQTQAIDSLIKQASDLYEQGIVTQNDVLRFKLQRSETQINSTQLEAERRTVQYSLNLLLGLPEDTTVVPAPVLPPMQDNSTLDSLLAAAFRQRQELKQYGVQSSLDQFNIRSIKAGQLPTLSGSITADYIHAGAEFIPPAGTYLTPISAGVTVAWNFSTLWSARHHISQAKVKQEQTLIQRDRLKENIQQEVNTCYQHYQQALQTIQLLQSAIDQAAENNRIQTDRYQYNTTSVTDMIDANSRLYQAMANIAIARSDASLAWFRLLKATGSITTSY
ncbi:TolC family protein [Chitinophaga varians]|uniref:TolC family protein n=1 Tax=Chitinophaga varians TaxID=2202339 RepID=UPI00165F74CC|nr:TolC family protein [Chitinophaga varians]MBC9912601.1 TolC family protein [Chitinophaga varians]